MIDILKTEGYSLEEFKTLLDSELAKSKRLEIVVPKSPHSIRIENPVRSSPIVKV